MMNRAASLALSALFVLITPARADVPGTFVGPGTYATRDGCEKLKTMAAGGFKEAGTIMPETLTMNGFLGWEGSCSFRSFTEVEPGRKWTAAMDCHEGAPAGPESDVFERMADGTLKVTIMGNDTIFVRCDAGDKAKAGKDAGE